MFICKQINNKECGVCVLNTLVYKYYHVDIKNKILNDSKIEEEGLSVYDLELLGEKYGVEIDSYQGECNEMLACSKNKDVIVLFSETDGYHYTLLRQKNKNIHIYDSKNGHYIISEEELKKKYTGYFFIPTKSKKNLKSEKKNYENSSKHIDVKYLLINCIIYLTITTISIALANYISMCFEFSIAKNSIYNMIFIGIAYLLLSGANFISENIISTLNWKRYKENYLKKSYTFLKNIQMKKTNFFNKLNKDYVLYIPSILEQLSYYETSSNFRFINSFISAIIIFNIISYINILYCIPLIIFILFSLMLYYFGYLFNKKNKWLYTSNVNLLQAQFNHYSLMHNSSNPQENHQAIKNYKEAFRQQCNNIKRSNQIKEFSFSCNGLLYKICCLIFMSLSCYIYINTSVELNLNSVIFVILLFAIFSENTINISNYFYDRKNYHKYNEIYESIINVSNHSNGKKSIRYPNSLSITHNKIYKKIANGTNIYNYGLKDFDKLLTRTLSLDNCNIYINSVDIKKIKQEWINDRIYIFYPTTVTSKWDETLLNISNYPLIANFFKKTKYVPQKSNTKNMHDLQLINILYASTLRNKIIYFDNCFNYIDTKTLQVLEKEIIPHIKKNNFLLFNIPKVS